MVAMKHINNKDISYKDINHIKDKDISQND